MLSYISQGNLKECLHIFQSSDGDGAPLNMDDVYHRYPDDFLRSVKNSMGSISYKYGLLIEGSSSVEFLQKKVTPMMFSDYCLAVRDCSTAQYSAKVQEIITYILEHLPSELTVNQLAELFFLNVSSLSRKFKSETGFSVTEFINFHRIKLALLQNVQEGHFHHSESVFKECEDGGDADLDWKRDRRARCRRLYGGCGLFLFAFCFRYFRAFCRYLAGVVPYAFLIKSFL